MQPVSLYFAPALLLLLCPFWQLSRCVPVTSSEPIKDSCVFYARMLLKNVTEVLTQRQLFTGIDCTKQSVELNMNTNTASVCAPGESTCAGFTTSKFDQNLCLTNIGEDLRYYYKFLADQPDPDNFLSSVLLSLREFMENCFSRPADLNKVSAGRPSSYDERLSLCKVLKGFQLRTITINRALGFINSGKDMN